MKIKSILMAVSLSIMGLAVFAQKSELNSAKNNYEKFVQLKDAGSLPLAMPSIKSAKTAIDKAAVNEKTLNDPAVWAYKSLIYADLALTDTANTPASEKIMEEAKSAYQKATEIDADGANKTLLIRANDLFAQQELNKGVKAYQSRRFEDAYNSFNKSLIYKPGDTTITYYAGLAAINFQNYPAAITKYESLLETNFSANKEIALDLSRIYAIQKDTTKALGIASKYAAKYNDGALATWEIELSLMTGKEKQIISKITEQIARDPKNRVHHFYLGIAYGAIKDYKKSEEAYIKALEIDPKFEDASLNLSSTILNQGIDLYNTANSLPPNKQKEYDAGIKQANVEFERALPYLIRTTEINPKSRNAWENLKTYYIIKRNQAKVDEINKLISEL